MSDRRHLLHGIVQGGVIIPDQGVSLPDGTEVEFSVQEPAVEPIPFTPEEAAEFAAWDRLSAEAMKCIEDLERQERDEGR